MILRQSPLKTKKFHVQINYLNKKGIVSKGLFNSNFIYINIDFIIVMM